MYPDNPGALEAEAELPGQDNESKSQGWKEGGRKKRKPKGQGLAQRHMQLPRVDSEPDSFDLLVPLPPQPAPVISLLPAQAGFLVLYFAFCPLSHQPHSPCSCH